MIKNKVHLIFKTSYSKIKVQIYAEYLLRNKILMKISMPKDKLNLFFVYNYLKSKSYLKIMVFIQKFVMRFMF
jgi:hypothetical protein